MKSTVFLLLLAVCGCHEATRPSFPSIHLQIPLDSIPLEEKKGCLATITDRHQTQHIRVGIEYRGSASRKFPKRSFSLHIREKLNKNLQWLDMPLHGDWVLYAPYADRTCIRNALAHTMFRSMGHYSPRSRFVELTIDTSWLGLYEWREKIDLSTGRVPTATQLLKFDKPTAKRRREISSHFNRLIPIRFHDSLPGHTIDAAFAAVIEFEKALESPDEQWKHHADERSFIDYFLLTELANSPDAYRSSCYFQILPNSKLRMGPVWDFDLAFGNSNILHAQDITRWRFQYNEADSFKNLAAPIWWSNLYNRPAFRSALLFRWQELRRNILSDSSISKQIDELSIPIRPQIEKNHAKWSVMNRLILWTVPAEKNYDEEVRKLKSWTFRRAAWMDDRLKIEN